MRRHYDSISIVCVTILHIHFDKLHNSRTLIYLTKLLLEFIEDRWTVSLIISRVNAFNLFLIDLNVNKVAITIRLYCSAGPSI